MKSPEDKGKSIGRIQIEQQLRRIITSRVFAGGDGVKKNEQLARMLEYIVTKTLNTNRVSENDLLIDFFGILPQDCYGNSIARSTLVRLRKKLATYDALVGLNDPVLIEVPKGQCGALFKSNPRSPAQKELKLGFYYVNRESPDDSMKALKHFDEALRLEPDLADAYAGKSSALIAMTLHEYSHDPRLLLQQAEDCALKASLLDDTSWLAQANLGTVHLYRHEWEDADKHLEQAQKLGPFEMDSYGNFGPYLLSRGRYEEGLELAHRYLDEGYDDVVLLGRAALYLYWRRHFIEAEEILLRARQMEPNFWRTPMYLALCSLASNRPEQALECMLETERLISVDLWPGLKVLCFEAAGRSNEAQRKFSELERAGAERYVKPMQLSIGLMALGRPIEAIAYLSKACDEFDPFTAFLHLLPFLDPLRSYPEFRQLLRKWKFPSP